MLPVALSDTIGKILLQLYGKPVQIKSVTPLGGGCINQSCRLDTFTGSFFIKYNRADAYKGMFSSEAEGLKQLLNTGSIRIPSVIENGETEDYTFLMLEFIHQGRKGTGFWEGFGSALANLHKQSHEAFGWGFDNYIGSLPQSNKAHKAWNDFFILERLEPMLKLARDGKKISPELARRFDALYNRFNEIFPPESPAFLHGDLWSGNFLVDETGSPCLIDPAVYFGHREADLAMTHLFGGFSEAFYSAYHAAFPLEKGWEKRIDIFNLYPLLVHVNLFGGGYVSDVARIMAHY
jgi:fructosamine-3-kinase